MTYNHNDYVTVYDRNGNMECRGKIKGVHQIVGGSIIYDIDPDYELSLSARLCGIAASRVRRAYSVPKESQAKVKPFMDEYKKIASENKPA